MKQELQDKLFQKYPEIFKEHNLSPQETCMVWGCQCDQGWYDIIDATCEALTYMYSTGVALLPEDIEKYGGVDKKEYLTVESPQIVFQSVKEKFATLRIYYRLEWPDSILELLKTNRYPDLQKIVDRFDNYIDGIIHMAEILSGRTCEVTGKPGELHVSGGNWGGWYKTLNVEFAKTDPFYVSRKYVPVSSLEKLEEKK